MCSGYANPCNDLVPFGDLILDVVLARRRDPEDFERLLETSATWGEPGNGGGEWSM